MKLTADGLAVGIDVTTAGSGVIFIPNKDFLVEKIITRYTDTSGYECGPQITVGTNGPDFDNVLSGLSESSAGVAFDVLSNVKVIPAGTPLGWKIATGSEATGTNLEISVYVLGIEL